MKVYKMKCDPIGQAMADKSGTNEVAVLKENVNTSETTNQVTETGAVTKEKENVDLKTSDSNILDTDNPTDECIVKHASVNSSGICMNGESKNDAEKLDADKAVKDNDASIESSSDTSSKDVERDVKSGESSPKTDLSKSDASNQAEIDINKSTENNSDEGITIIEERSTPKVITKDPAKKSSRANANQTVLVQQLVNKNVNLPKLAPIPQQSLGKNVMMPVQYGLVGSNGQLLIPTNNIRGNFPITSMSLSGQKIANWNKSRAGKSANMNIVGNVPVTRVSSNSNILSTHQKVKTQNIIGRDGKPVSIIPPKRGPSIEERTISYISKMRVPLNMVNLCYAVREYIKYHDLHRDPLTVDFDELLKQQSEDDERKKALRMKKKRKIEEIVIIDDDQDEKKSCSDNKKAALNTSTKENDKKCGAIENDSSDSVKISEKTDVSIKDCEIPNETGDEKNAAEKSENVPAVTETCEKKNSASEQKIPTNETDPSDESSKEELTGDKPTTDKYVTTTETETSDNGENIINKGNELITDKESSEKEVDDVEPKKKDETVLMDVESSSDVHNPDNDEKSSKKEKDEETVSKDVESAIDTHDGDHKEKPSLKGKDDELDKMEDNVDSTTKNENADSTDTKEKKDEKAGDESDSEIKVIKDETGGKEILPKIECFTDDVDTEHESVARKLRPVARYLYFMGLDFTKEKIYKDVIISKTNAAKRRKLNEAEEKQLKIVKYGSMKLAKKTRPFHYKEFEYCSCGFATESSNVLYYHRQQGHVDKTGKYSCAMCDYESRMCREFTFHMESDHNMEGKLQAPPAFWECNICSFENSAKNRVTRHRFKCEEKFDMKKHLFPNYDDINFLFRSLPGELIMRDVPKAAVTRPQRSVIPSNPVPVPSANKISTNSVVPNVAVVQPIIKPSRQVVQTKPQVYYYMTPNGPVPITVQSGTTVNSVPPKMITSSLVPNVSSNSSMPRLSNVSAGKVGKKRPAILTTSNAPETTRNTKAPNYSYEICEICSGFIKDKESLRIHFMMAHKIEISSEMFMRRASPPLSCDVCQERFWTFQGLTHHRVVKKHRVPEGGVCHLCSQPATKMHTHLTLYHNLDTVTARVLKICPICGASITPEGIKDMVYHLQVSHSIVLPNGKLKKCKVCGLNFANQKMFDKHVLEKHGIRCPRCPFVCKWQGELQKHLTGFHGVDSQYCLICKKTIMRGKPFINHVCQMHIRKCVVKLTRCNVSKMKRIIRQRAAAARRPKLTTDDDDDDVKILDRSTNSVVALS
ncbi:uncharacterized protein LOC141902038 isoform X2 [Tubulanus polymorphus]